MNHFEPQSMATILENASRQLKKNFPFVIYNKPNSSQIIGIFQQNDLLYFVENFKEKGFIFAPFNGIEIVLIPENQSQIQIANFEKTLGNEVLNFRESKDRSEAKNKFENVVQKAIDAIQSGRLSKVVLSREEIVEFSEFDSITILERLFNFYPSAFSYCFFHPKLGLWLGSFSYQFLKM